MKLILLFLLLIPFTAFNQKNTGGYAYIQPAFFIKKGWQNNVSLNVGVGFMPSKTMGFGASFDAFVFKKGTPLIVARADVRPFLNSKDNKVAYFISMQPGAVLYSKRIKLGNITYTSKGNVAADLLVGMFGISPGKNSMGITMSFGYSLLSFSVNDKISAYHGFKFQGGIAF